jgi:hypothetical protein
VSAHKAKGTAYETALVRALGAFFRGRFGLKPYRPAQAGFQDTGDLHGLSPYIGQAKNYRSWEIAIREGLDGAEKQKGHAGEAYGVAFVKRIRRSVGQGYAVQTVETWARVLMRLRRAEALLAEHAPEALAGHMDAVAEELNEPFPTYGAQTE